jgi:hypothetical protein
MLTNQQKAQVFDNLKSLAAVFEVKKTEQVLTLYVESLSKFNFEEVNSAIKWAITNCKFFPKPVELIEQINPKRSRVDADYLAGEVMQAVKTFGMYQGSKAKKELGSEAWKAVEFNGGWVNLCNTTPERFGVVRAQLRDSLLGVFDMNNILQRKRNQLASTEKLKITNQNIEQSQASFMAIGFQDKNKKHLELFKNLNKKENP